MWRQERKKTAPKKRRKKNYASWSRWCEKNLERNIWSRRDARLGSKFFLSPFFALPSTAAYDILRNSLFKFVFNRIPSFIPPSRVLHKGRASTLNSELSFPSTTELFRLFFIFGTSGYYETTEDILPVFARRQPEEEIKSEANAERKRHGAAITSTIRGKKDFALLAKLQFNSSSFIPSFRYSSHVMATSCDGANQELAMRHTLRAVNKRLMYRAFASLT